MKFKVTKGKITAAVIIVLVLVVSFVWGGGYARPGSGSAGGVPSPGALTAGASVTPGALGALGDEDGDGADGVTGPAVASGPAATTSESVVKPTPAGIESRPGGVEGGLTAEEKLKLAASMGGSSPNVEKGSESYSAEQGMEINASTGKDQYLTDPVPEGKPVPVEPQNAAVSDKKMTCTLSVRCDSILNNMDWLDPEKVELVPADGVIFASQKVTFYEGESVFNLLQREMKNNKIHMEFVNTPIYNSAYIEGINNLYEFDCGELSGWMYKVNGWFPNYGCSRYQLKEGDVVEWVYTCDLGRDVGGYYATGGE